MRAICQEHTVPECTNKKKTTAVRTHSLDTGRCASPLRLCWHNPITSPLHVTWIPIFCRGGVLAVPSTFLVGFLGSLLLFFGFGFESLRCPKSVPAFFWFSAVQFGDRHWSTISRAWGEAETCGRYASVLLIITDCCILGFALVSTNSYLQWHCALRCWDPDHASTSWSIISCFIYLIK